MMERMKDGGDDAPEQIIIDGNVEATGQAHCDINDVVPSPDHKLVAYSIDTTVSPPLHPPTTQSNPLMRPHMDMPVPNNNNRAETLCLPAPCLVLVGRLLIRAMKSTPSSLGTLPPEKTWMRSSPTTPAGFVGVLRRRNCTT